MVRLLLVFTVVAAVAGAPVVVEACKLTCVAADSHETTGGRTTPEHICHEVVGTAAPSATIAAVHVCGHTTELPAASPSPQPVDGDLALSSTLAQVDHSRSELGWLGANRRPTLPDRIARTTQLRL